MWWYWLILVMLFVLFGFALFRLLVEQSFEARAEYATGRVIGLRELSYNDTDREGEPPIVLPYVRPMVEVRLPKRFLQVELRNRVPIGMLHEGTEVVIRFDPRDPRRATLAETPSRVRSLALRALLLALVVAGWGWLVR